MRKLHLGCGKVYLPDWTNVDAFSNSKADEYADVTSLPYERASFELIYASHVLEHVHRRMVLATLNHWKNLLVPGGTLRIAVPDFQAVCERYQETGDLEEVMGLLYGGQDYHLNRHTVTFDFGSLAKALIQVGFHGIEKWDWRKTEHSEYDDFSQCYLPHLNKESGKLMSLNVMAVK